MYYSIISFRTFISSLFFIITVHLQAQINLCEGFYISLEGQMIKGKIDNQEWVSNPDFIQFTATGLEKDMKPLFPKDVKSIHIIRKDKFEEIYVSKRIQIELSSSNLNALSSQEQPEWSEFKDVFLKQIVKGRLSLYLYKDNLKRKTTYLKKDQLIIEDEHGELQTLIYKRYLTDRNIAKVNESYKSQLIKKLIDCSKTDINEINRLEYNVQSIEKLIVKYNNCFNNTSSYRYKAEKRPKEFGVFAGAMATKIDMTVSNLPTNIFPAVGLYVKIPFTATSPKVGLLCELLPVAYRGKTEYHYIYYDKSEYLAKDEYNINLVRLNLLVGYTRPLNGNNSITFYGGISGGYIFKKEIKNSYEMTKDFTGKVNITESDIFRPLWGRGLEQGFILGTRYKIGKLGFDLRYAATNGWEIRSLYYTFIKSFSFMTTYNF